MHKFLYLYGPTDINAVKRKQTIIFGHTTVTNFLTTIPSTEDEY
jgi:hypothetical protein